MPSNTPDSTVVAAVIGVIGLLLGTVIGAIATYFATSKQEEKRWQRERQLEGEKWQRQKKDELAEARRAALRHAAAWIQPIELAVSEAHTRAGRAGRAKSRLSSEMSRLDMHIADTFLLPNGIYQTPALIIHQLEEILLTGDALLEDELISKLVTLREIAAQFRERIKEEYNATYN
jgi:hypothetical protein